MPPSTIWKTPHSLQLLEDLFKPAGLEEAKIHVHKVTPDKVWIYKPNPNAKSGVTVVGVKPDQLKKYIGVAVDAPKGHFDPAGSIDPETYSGPHDLEPLTGKEQAQKAKEAGEKAQGIDPADVETPTKAQRAQQHQALEKEKEVAPETDSNKIGKVGVAHGLAGVVHNPDTGAVTLSGHPDQIKSVLDKTGHGHHASGIHKDGNFHHVTFNPKEAVPDTSGPNIVAKAREKGVLATHGSDVSGSGEDHGHVALHGDEKKIRQVLKDTGHEHQADKIQKSGKGGASVGFHAGASAAEKEDKEQAKSGRGFPVGHVSHRTDGDYEKQKDGSWIPVKPGHAGGGARANGGAGEPQSKKAPVTDPHEVVAKSKEHSGIAANYHDHSGKVMVYGDEPHQMRGFLKDIGHDHQQVTQNKHGKSLAYFDPTDHPDVKKGEKEPEKEKEPEQAAAPEKEPEQEKEPTDSVEPDAYALSHPAKNGGVKFVFGGTSKVFMMSKSKEELEKHLRDSGFGHAVGKMQWIDFAKEWELATTLGELGIQDKNDFSKPHPALKVPHIKAAKKAGIDVDHNTKTGDVSLHSVSKSKLKDFLGQHGLDHLAGQIARGDGKFSLELKKQKGKKKLGLPTSAEPDQAQGQEEPQAEKEPTREKKGRAATDGEAAAAKLNALLAPLKKTLHPGFSLDAFENSEGKTKVTLIWAKKPSDMPPTGGHELGDLLKKVGLGAHVGDVEQKALGQVVVLDPKDVAKAQPARRTTDAGTAEPEEEEGAAEPQNTSELFKSEKLVKAAQDAGVTMHHLPSGAVILTHTGTDASTYPLDDLIKQAGLNPDDYADTLKTVSMGAVKGFTYTLPAELPKLAPEVTAPVAEVSKEGPAAHLHQVLDHLSKMISDEDADPDLHVTFDWAAPDPFTSETVSVRAKSQTAISSFLIKAGVPDAIHSLSSDGPYWEAKIPIKDVKLPGAKEPEAEPEEEPNDIEKALAAADQVKEMAAQSGHDKHLTIKPVPPDHVRVVGDEQDVEEFQQAHHLNYKFQPSGKGSFGSILIPISALKQGAEAPAEGPVSGGMNGFPDLAAAMDHFDKLVPPGVEPFPPGGAENEIGFDGPISSLQSFLSSHGIEGYEVDTEGYRPGKGGVVVPLSAFKTISAPPSPEEPVQQPGEPAAAPSVDEAFQQLTNKAQGTHIDVSHAEMIGGKIRVAIDAKHPISELEDFLKAQGLEDAIPHIVHGTVAHVAYIDPKDLDPKVQLFNKAWKKASISAGTHSWDVEIDDEPGEGDTVKIKGSGKELAKVLKGLGMDPVAHGVDPDSKDSQDILVKQDELMQAAPGEKSPSVGYVPAVSAAQAAEHLKGLEGLPENVEVNSGAYKVFFGAPEGMNEKDSEKLLARVSEVLQKHGIPHEKSGAFAIHVKPGDVSVPVSAEQVPTTPAVRGADGKDYHMAENGSQAFQHLLAVASDHPKVQVVPLENGNVAVVGEMGAGMDDLAAYLEQAGLGALAGSMIIAPNGKPQVGIPAGMVKMPAPQPLAELPPTPDAAILHCEKVSKAWGLTHDDAFVATTPGKPGYLSIEGPSAGMLITALGIPGAGFEAKDDHLYHVSLAHLKLSDATFLKADEPKEPEAPAEVGITPEDVLPPAPSLEAGAKMSAKEWAEKLGYETKDGKFPWKVGGKSQPTSMILLPGNQPIAKLHAFLKQAGIPALKIAEGDKKHWALVLKSDLENATHAPVQAYSHQAAEEFGIKLWHPNPDSPHLNVALPDELNPEVLSNFLKKLGIEPVGSTSHVGNYHMVQVNKVAFDSSTGGTAQPAPTVTPETLPSIADLAKKKGIRISDKKSMGVGGDHVLLQHSSSEELKNFLKSAGLPEDLEQDALGAYTWVQTKDVEKKVTPPAHTVAELAKQQGITVGGLENDGSQWLSIPSHLPEYSLHAFVKGMGLSAYHSFTANNAHHVQVVGSEMSGPPKAQTTLSAPNAISYKDLAIASGFNAVTDPYMPSLSLVESPSKAALQSFLAAHGLLNPNYTISQAADGKYYHHVENSKFHAEMPHSGYNPSSSGPTTAAAILHAKGVMAYHNDDGTTQLIMDKDVPPDGFEKLLNHMNISFKKEGNGAYTVKKADLDKETYGPPDDGKKFSPLKGNNYPHFLNKLLGPDALHYQYMKVGGVPGLGVPEGHAHDVSVLLKQQGLQIKGTSMTQEGNVFLQLPEDKLESLFYSHVQQLPSVEAAAKKAGYQVHKSGELPGSYAVIQVPKEGGTKDDLVNFLSQHNVSYVPDTLQENKDGYTVVLTNGELDKAPAHSLPGEAQGKENLESVHAILTKNGVHVGTSWKDGTTTISMLGTKPATALWGLLNQMGIKPHNIVPGEEGEPHTAVIKTSDLCKGLSPDSPHAEKVCSQQDALAFFSSLKMPKAPNHKGEMVEALVAYAHPDKPGKVALGGHLSKEELGKFLDEQGLGSYKDKIEDHDSFITGQKQYEVAIDPADVKTLTAGGQPKVVSRESFHSDFLTQLANQHGVQVVKDADGDSKFIIPGGKIADMQKFMGLLGVDKTNYAVSASSHEGKKGPAAFLKKEAVKFHGVLGKLNSYLKEGASLTNGDIVVHGDVKGNAIRIGGLPTADPETQTLQLKEHLDKMGLSALKEHIVNNGSLIYVQTSPEEVQSVFHSPTKEAVQKLAKKEDPSAEIPSASQPIKTAEDAEKYLSTFAGPGWSNNYSAGQIHIEASQDDDGNPTVGLTIQKPKFGPIEPALTTLHAFLDKTGLSHLKDKINAEGVFNYTLQVPLHALKKPTVAEPGANAAGTDAYVGMLGSKLKGFDVKTVGAATVMAVDHHGDKEGQKQKLQALLDHLGIKENIEDFSGTSGVTIPSSKMPKPKMVKAAEAAEAVPYLKAALGPGNPAITDGGIHMVAGFGGTKVTVGIKKSDYQKLNEFLDKMGLSEHKLKEMPDFGTMATAAIPVSAIHVPGHPAKDGLSAAEYLKAVGLEELSPTPNKDGKLTLYASVVDKDKSANSLAEAGYPELAAQLKASPSGMIDVDPAEIHVPAGAFEPPTAPATSAAPAVPPAPAPESEKPDFEEADAAENYFNKLLPAGVKAAGFSDQDGESVSFRSQDKAKLEAALKAHGLDTSGIVQSKFGGGFKANFPVSKLKKKTALATGAAEGVAGGKPAASADAGSDHIDAYLKKAGLKNKWWVGVSHDKEGQLFMHTASHSPLGEDEIKDHLKKMGIDPSKVQVEKTPSGVVEMYVSHKDVHVPGTEAPADGAGTPTPHDVLTSHGVQIGKPDHEGDVELKLPAGKSTQELKALLKKVGLEASVGDVGEHSTGPYVYVKHAALGTATGAKVAQTQPAASQGEAISHLMSQPGGDKLHFSTMGAGAFVIKPNPPYGKKDLVKFLHDAGLGEYEKKINTLGHVEIPFKNVQVSAEPKETPEGTASEDEGTPTAYPAPKSLQDAYSQHGITASVPDKDGDVQLSVPADQKPLLAKFLKKLELAPIDSHVTSQGEPLFSKGVVNGEPSHYLYVPKAALDKVSKSQLATLNNKDLEDYLDDYGLKVRNPDKMGDKPDNDGDLQLQADSPHQLTAFLQKAGIPNPGIDTYKGKYYLSNYINMSLLQDAEKGPLQKAYKKDVSDAIFTHELSHYSTDGHGNVALKGTKKNVEDFVKHSGIKGTSGPYYHSSSYKNPDGSPKINDVDGLNKYFWVKKTDLEKVDISKFPSLKSPVTMFKPKGGGAPGPTSAGAPEVGLAKTAQAQGIHFVKDADGDGLLAIAPSGNSLADNKKLLDFAKKHGLYTTDSSTYYQNTHVVHGKVPGVAQAQGLYISPENVKKFQGGTEAQAAPTSTSPVQQTTVEDAAKKVGIKLSDPDHDGFVKLMIPSAIPDASDVMWKFLKDHGIHPDQKKKAGEDLEHWKHGSASGPASLEGLLHNAIYVHAEDLLKPANEKALAKSTPIPKFASFKDLLAQKGLTLDSAPSAKPGMMKVGVPSAEKYKLESFLKAVNYEGEKPIAYKGNTYVYLPKGMQTQGYSVEDGPFKGMKGQEFSPTQTMPLADKLKSKKDAEAASAAAAAAAAAGPKPMGPVSVEKMAQGFGFQVSAVAPDGSITIEGDSGDLSNFIKATGLHKDAAIAKALENPTASSGGKTKITVPKATLGKTVELPKAVSLFPKKVETLAQLGQLHNVAVTDEYYNTNITFPPGFPDNAIAEFMATAGISPSEYPVQTSGQKKIISLPKGSSKEFLPAIKTKKLIEAKEKELNKYKMPVVPEPTNYTKVGGGQDLGGAGEKTIYKDASGKKHIFKLAMTKGGGTAKPYSAAAQQTFSQIAKQVKHTVPVDMVKMDGKVGTMQAMLDLDEKTPTLGNKAPKDLEDSEKEDVASEHLLDWLMSQHDSHRNNFVKGKDGKVYGIDKEQGFKYFPDDKLDVNYHPNSQYGEQEPFYNTFWRDWSDGKFDFDPKSLEKYIDKIDAIDTHQYRETLGVYARSLMPDKGVEQEEFLHRAVNRKLTLRMDFEKFVTGLYRKRSGDDEGKFTFDGGWNGKKKAEPKPKPGMSTSADEALEFVKQKIQAGASAVSATKESGEKVQLLAPKTAAGLATLQKALKGAGLEEYSDKIKAGVSGHWVSIPHHAFPKVDKKKLSALADDLGFKVQDGPGGYSEISWPKAKGPPEDLLKFVHSNGIETAPNAQVTTGSDSHTIKVKTAALKKEVPKKVMKKLKELASSEGVAEKEYKDPASGATDPDKLTLKMSKQHAADKLAKFLHQAGVKAIPPQGSTPPPDAHGIITGSQYHIAVVDKKSYNEATVEKPVEEVQAPSSTTKGPDVKPWSGKPKYFSQVEPPTQITPNAHEFHTFHQGKIGVSKRFSSDGSLVEGNTAQAKKYIDDNGKEYYLFHFKLRKPAWQKLTTKGKSSSWKFPNAKYNASKDALVHTGSQSDTVPTRQWNHGDSELHIATGKDKYAYMGATFAKVYPEPGKTPGETFEELMNKADSSLGKEITRNPTADELMVAKLGRIFSQVAPQENDKLTESQRTVPELKKRLLAKGWTDVDIDRVKEVEVMPGYHGHVDVGRHRRLSDKYGYKFVFQGVSNQGAALSILQTGLKGILERNIQGIEADGASYGADVKSGSADGICTRLVTQGAFGHSLSDHGYSGGYQAILSPDVVDRVDTYYHLSDHYGCCAEGDSRWDNRPSMESAIEKQGKSYNSGAEFHIRKGVKLEKIVRMAANSETHRTALVQAAKQAGIQEVNGIPIDDFVVVVNSVQEVYEKYIKPLGMT